MYKRSKRSSFNPSFNRIPFSADTPSQIILSFGYSKYGNSSILGNIYSEAVHI